MRVLPILVLAVSRSLGARRLRHDCRPGAKRKSLGQHTAGEQGIGDPPAEVTTNLLLIDVPDFAAERAQCVPSFLGCIVRFDR